MRCWDDDFLAWKAGLTTGCEYQDPRHERSKVSVGADDLDFLMLVVLWYNVEEIWFRIVNPGAEVWWKQEQKNHSGELE